MKSVRETYREQGYVLFEQALSQELATRHVCDELLNEPPKDGGGTTHKIGLGEKRRFLRHRHADFPALEDFDTGQTIGCIATSCGVQNAMLFNEQFVVKAADEGAVLPGIRTVHMSVLTIPLILPSGLPLMMQRLIMVASISAP